jgi:hypothetical protein
MNRLGAGTRRHCLFAATIGLPTLTRAQSIPRIGFIRHGPPDALSEGFRQGMRDLGYVEGKNIVIEYRWTDGNIERIGPFIDEMMRMKVRVIVGAGDPVLGILRGTDPNRAARGNDATADHQSAQQFCRCGRSDELRDQLH